MRPGVAVTMKDTGLGGEILTVARHGGLTVKVGEEVIVCDHSDVLLIDFN